MEGASLESHLLDIILARFRSRLHGHVVGPVLVASVVLGGAPPVFLFCRSELPGLLCGLRTNIPL